MPADVLTIALDTVEPRIQTDSLAMLVSGDEWDLPRSYNAWLEYLTSTGMLYPLPATAEWETTGSGLYYRLHKADYVLPTPAAWTEFHRRFNGDVYLHALNTNEPVSTAAVWPRNKGFHVSWFAFNVGNEDFVQLECGLGYGTSTDIRLRFAANGGVEIWKNGSQVGDGSIAETVLYPTDFGPKGGASGSNPGSSSKQTARQTVDVLIIPCRRRDLLVLSNQGGGFVFRFEDIDPDNPDPTITGPGPFWWQVPSGQAQVQVAPLNFLTVGKFVGPPFRFRFPPPTGAALNVTPYYDTPGFGTSGVAAELRLPDDSAPFVANGVLQTARLRLDMIGDGFSSPWIYGGSAVYERVTADTAGPETVLDDFLLGDKPPTLAVGEDPSDVSLTITLRSPEELEDAGAAQIKQIGNRPIEAKIGAVAIFTGRTNSPKWEDYISDETAEIVKECRDRWKALEQYRFQDPTPYDTMQLSAAVREIAMLPGYPASDMEIEDFDFPLPGLTDASKGEWALLPRVGDTAADWLKKLWETYARTFFMGWVPTADGPKFRFRSPEDLGTEAVLTLYDTHENAVTVGGYLEEDAWKYVYTSYREETFECEANDLYVTGYNPRTHRPLIAHYADAVSMDPTLAPADRPTNWVGEPRRYGWVDSSLISQEVCNYCLAILRKRLVPSRRVGEWGVQFCLKEDGAPLWRGEVLELYNLGRFRVNTLSGPFEIEHQKDDLVQWDAETIWRPFKYVGEWIGE